MKHFIFLILVISYAITSYCQRTLDTSDLSLYGKWPQVTSPSITSNGKYASYVIKNYPINQHTLILCSTENSWKKEFVGASFIGYSQNGNHAVFKTNDILFIFPLGGDTPRKIEKVVSCQLPGLGQWVAYQLDNDSKELVLLNLSSFKEHKLNDISDYAFGNNGKNLVVKFERLHGNGFEIGLKWINLIDEPRVKTVWASNDFIREASVIKAFTISDERDQLAFIVQSKINGQNTSSIWYYKSGMDKAISKINDELIGDDMWSINNSLEFSGNGKWVFFDLEHKQEQLKVDLNAAMVDVWNYKDIDLQPEQMRQLENGSVRCKAAFNTENSHWLRLDRENEFLVTSGKSVPGDHVIIATNFYDNHFASSWRDTSLQPEYYLMSLKDGTRHLFSKSNKLAYLSFSPNGKYVVFYSSTDVAFFCYDISLNKLTNITRNVPTDICDESFNSVNRWPVSSIISWRNDDSRLLIYDSYDIWEVDPMAKTLPFNITNGFGLRNKIKLRALINSVYSPKMKFIIAGFNIENKHSGFYQHEIMSKGDPKLLVMGPYTYYHDESHLPGNHHEFDRGMPPLKAKDSDTWIIKRQTATEAPNYFVTRDFREYKSISDLQPQKGYNWLTTELVTWNMLDGRKSQGILYRPENYDKSIKYPLIINYYEKLSHRLYEFPYPRLITANIDIPWFVSNGYFVFTPDIYYSNANSSGKPVGEWAYNSVVSAAEYLVKHYNVNREKIGIQGHSFGGLQTNYLITNTTMFAAAVEAAGSSDPISNYLSLLPFLSKHEHHSPQDGMENGHSLYGCMPWQNPEIYRKNSAVLHADRVSTPLLIMHNMRDNQIPWRQGIELYMALTRLGKKVWMLQYDDESHVIHLEKNAMDFTIRVTQFFDYYLKDKLPPSWMTKGIPAKLKGINRGFELDDSGQKP